MGLVYEPITTGQRAQLGLLVALAQGTYTYGLIGGLARDLGTSRQFLYRLAGRVRTAVAQAVAPRPPGPAPGAPPIAVDRGRLDRAIVTLGLVGHVPQRAIADCLAEVYEVRPSLGYVNGVLNQAGAAAAAVQAQFRLALPTGEVAADELFVGDQAQLVVVEPQSLLVLAATPPSTQEAPTSPTAAAWEAVFAGVQAQSGALQRVASDGGAALAAAVAQLPGVEHQLDLWHVVRQVGWAERALARTAYAAIKAEYALARKAQPLDPAHPMGGYVWQRYQAAQQAATTAIRQYDDLCILGAWARESLAVLDPRTGRVRSTAEGLADLQVVIGLLRDLRARAADTLATTLAGAGPGVLAYADRLQRALTTLTQELGDAGPVGVPLLCREWECQRQLAHARAAARLAGRLVTARAHLAALLHWGPAYPTAREQVWTVLTTVLRGSSLVECVNSWLRPYATLLKRLGRSFLALFQLFRNARVFPRGQRAGQSPLALAGVDTPAGDWLDWLGLHRVPSPTRPVRSVRALPRSA